MVGEEQLADSHVLDGIASALRGHPWWEYPTEILCRIGHLVERTGRPIDHPPHGMPVH